MWSINASDGRNESRTSESDARWYVARQFPNADRIGIYAYRWHGIDVTLNHKF